MYCQSDKKLLQYGSHRPHRHVLALVNNVQYIDRGHAQVCSPKCRFSWTIRDFPLNPVINGLRGGNFFKIQDVSISHVVLLYFAFTEMYFLPLG